MKIVKIAKENLNGKYVIPQRSPEDYRGLRIVLREFNVKDINSILTPAILDIVSSGGKKTNGTIRYKNKEIGLWETYLWE